MRAEKTSTTGDQNALLAEIFPCHDRIFPRFFGCMSAFRTARRDVNRYMVTGFITTLPDCDLQFQGRGG
jgi:hypothetical protein